MEIGGYLELEVFKGEEYHKNALALNSARKCFELYLLNHKEIKKVYIPYYICETVYEACKCVGVDYELYHIDAFFKPIFNNTVCDDELLYVVNFYGQLSNDYLSELKNKYKRIFIDNTQAFFQMPINDTPTVYTCRKFFGVPDGAYIYSDNLDTSGLELDCSYGKMLHITGRFEKTANEFYSPFADNDRRLEASDIKLMSKLTHNLLRGIDYENALNVRNNNFKALDDKLKSINKLILSAPCGAFMYPLYLDNGFEIRKQLQGKKIYVPTLWRGVFDVCGSSDLEYDFAENILPLPIDQRYDVDIMNYIIGEIEKCLD